MLINTSAGRSRSVNLPSGYTNHAHEVNLLIGYCMSILFRIAKRRFKYLRKFTFAELLSHSIPDASIIYCGDSMPYLKVKNFKFEWRDKHSYKPTGPSGTMGPSCDLKEYQVADTTNKERL